MSTVRGCGSVTVDAILCGNQEAMRDGRLTGIDENDLAARAAGRSFSG